jgi:hypothetical protein
MSKEQRWLYGAFLCGCQLWRRGNRLCWGDSKACQCDVRYYAYAVSFLYRYNTLGVDYEIWFNTQVQQP